MKYPPSATVNQQPGFILIALLASTMLIIVVCVATAQLTVSNLKRSTTEQYRVDAQFASDAGIDAAIYELNQNDNWTGTTGEVTLLDDNNIKVTYQAAVLADDPTEPLRKLINVTGRTYSPNTSVTPKVVRKFQVAMRGVTSSGDYSLVTGVGGLIMSNNAKIVSGNVFVNGTISLSNSAQIGLTSNPVNVKVAHQNCPAIGGAGYPRACATNENGQPISLSGTAKMYGEIQANNQTDGTGMSNPGLVPGTVTPATLPTHDRASQVAAVATTQTGSTAGCSSGIKSWPANLKINGDVTLSNTCKVTVQGNVWITGKLVVDNSSQLIVANTLASAPVIMIDGASGITIKNNGLLKSNNNTTPIGFRVVTYWSKASCSPGCPDVTGGDLFDSRNTPTIVIDNSGSGPNTEFYARWTRVNLKNGGNVGSVVGQTVELNNSAAITFGQTVSGLGGGGVEAWVIDSYKRTY